MVYPQSEAGGQLGLATQSGCGAGGRVWGLAFLGLGHLAAGDVHLVVAFWPVAVSSEVQLHVNSCRHLGHPPSGGGRLTERPAQVFVPGQKKKKHNQTE